MLADRDPYWASLLNAQEGLHVLYQIVYLTEESLNVSSLQKIDYRLPGAVVGTKINCKWASGISLEL